MIDLEDTLARAATIALNIAEDTSQRPTTRLQAVSACARCVSALSAHRSTLHAREVDDLVWLARAVDRPVGALPGPSGAMIDGLRLKRVDRIIEAHAQEKHVPEVPDW